MKTKIAIITGGSRGLGKNAALHLAASGVDIILTYQNNASAAEEVVKEIEKIGRRAVALKLDVGKSNEFASFAEIVKGKLSNIWQTNSFDFLINNAGMGIYSTIAETTEEQFDSLMNVHLKGTFFLVKELLPLIKDGGKILNVSSGLTRFTLSGYAAYAAMKGGIEVFTRYLAKELGPRKITVNTIAPGAIETDFGGGAVRDNTEVNKFIASQTILERVGIPDDIGGAITMLLSPESGWINAQRIEASGGMFV